MEAVRGGDSRQLAILFERHHQALYRFYMRHTGNSAQCEDLVQEVFCRLLRHGGTYTPGMPFVPWMYRIARNAHIDSERRRRPEVPISGDWQTPVSAARTYEDREQHALLRRAIQALPPAKREVLLLARFQGLKYEEIAGVLGCEISTVKVRVFRAVQSLREVFLEMSAGKAS